MHSLGARLCRTLRLAGVVNQVEDPTLWPKRTDGGTCRGVGLRHRDPAACFLRLKMRTAGQRLGTLHRRFLLIASKSASF
ncbi:hypothetical protein RB8512 [Rhodopirellula baltica SH 1]|uniref:Uncharacterized protein n=1 Tax=Rhodopirellula baltica (strain DSM 10527 / NCIMB 13988 / SH1) TaxID=243090 RepID=Q7UFK2_RHOBA|nr:hypothetical protein RB8512 [Rhodopirellula baltica SH 1]